MTTTPGTTTLPVTCVPDTVAIPTVTDTPETGVVMVAGISEPPSCTASITGAPGSWDRDGVMFLFLGKDIDARNSRKMRPTVKLGALVTRNVQSFANWWLSHQVLATIKAREIKN